MTILIASWQLSYNRFLHFQKEKNKLFHVKSFVKIQFPKRKNKWLEKMQVLLEWESDLFFNVRNSPHWKHGCITLARPAYMLNESQPTTRGTQNQDCTKMRSTFDSPWPALFCDGSYSQPLTYMNGTSDLWKLNHHFSRNWIEKGPCHDCLAQRKCLQFNGSENALLVVPNILESIVMLVKLKFKGSISLWKIVNS